LFESHLSDEQLHASNERAVRIAGGMLALIAIPAVVHAWWAPWDDGAVWMRVVMPTMAALFITVAATGQGSPQTARMLKAMAVVSGVGWAAGHVLPLMRHLPAGFLVISAAVAIAANTLWFAAARHRVPVLVAFGAAMAALPLLRDRLGPYDPPLPGYWDTAFVILEMDLAVAALVALAHLMRPARR
jgi:hypothetical protein